MLHSLLLSLIISCVEEEGTQDNEKSSADTTDIATSNEVTCEDDDLYGDDIDQNCDGIDGIDQDADGFASVASGGTDCDDSNAEIHPDATEICDEIDNNCDGNTDDNDENLDLSTASTWYADSDGDSFGDLSTTTQTCVMPSEHVADSSDCDDSNGDIHPDATEICDEIDNNCDGNADDNDENLDLSTASTWYADNDGDSFGDLNMSIQSCMMPNGYAADSNDCDDSNGDIHPDATEICDEIDNNCDGNADDNDEHLDLSTASIWYADSDGDSFGDLNTTTQTCVMPSGHVANSSDCNDNNVAIHPNATEICDEIDNNCDGNVDDDDGNLDLSTASTWYADNDGDTYGDLNTSTQTCAIPNGYVANSSDCNDNSLAINPAATEVCDGLDNDCDNSIDDNDSNLDLSTALTWYADNDGDSYGDPDQSAAFCISTVGYVSDNSDCDDNNSSVSPGASEVWYDGIDSDCDGANDYDADSDGYLSDAYGGDDCDDSDNTVNILGTEIEDDGIDQDCDGSDLTSEDTGNSSQAVSDFVLTDVNPNSPLYGQQVSPRDYLQQVSGWYYIKST